MNLKMVFISEKGKQINLEKLHTPKSIITQRRKRTNQQRGTKDQSLKELWMGSARGEEHGIFKVGTVLYVIFIHINIQ